MVPARQSWLIPVSLACVASLMLAAAGAGLGAYRVMRLEAESTQAILVLGEVNSQAGRIEALVAGVADLRTDPARLPSMRDQLVAAVTKLDAASHQTDPGLAQMIHDYGEAGRRAADPDADTSPGALVRGDIDGEYPVLVATADRAAAAVQAAELRAVRHWQRVIVAGVLALGLIFVALSALVIGPLAVLIRRQRHRERADLARRLDTAAYIEQVIDSVDVGVMAMERDDGRLTINSAARGMLGILTPGPITRAELLGAAALWAPGSDTPLPLAEMPLCRAMAGERVPPTELRLMASPVHARPGTAGPEVPERRVVVRAGPLTSGEGGLIGAVATFQDVTALHTSNRLLTRKATEMTAIFQATRAVLREDNAREAVCHAAGSVSGAVLVGLFEDDGHGDLVCTTAVGADMLGLRMPVTSTSVIAEVFASVRTRVLSSLDSSAGVDHDLVDRLSKLCGHPLVGGAWIPVVVRGRCLAVMAVGFDGAVDPSAYVPTLEILAAETAVAIERQDLLRRLALEAETDALTGTANRRAWDTVLAEAIIEGRETGRQISALMLDVDHFKDYNDAHGHPAGDVLLREAAAAWSHRLRPGDVIARYGGEEFAVLLPGCGTAEGLAVAEALRTLMPGRQTCSAGVATWNGQETGAQLVARADAALYDAKRNGRNRTAVGTQTSLRVDATG